MRTILAFLFVFFFLIFSIPLMLIEWIIGHFNPTIKDRSSLAIVKWAFRCVTFFSGTKITVIGEENVPKDRAVLYIANHRSIFDIVLTYSRVPLPTGFIAKKELEKIPLLNIWIHNVHTLFIDRTNIKAGLQTIMTAINNVKSGISIFIFPEGTRNTTDDVLLPFKDGSFKIADKSGCPILPVTINNSRNIFETQTPWIKRTHVIIEYGKPIETTGLSKDEKRELSNKVASIITETYLKNQSLV